MIFQRAPDHVDGTILYWNVKARATDELHLILEFSYSLSKCDHHVTGITQAAAGTVVVHK